MKRLAASLVICGLLISSGGLALADNAKTKIVANSNSIEIIKPDSAYTITTNEKIVVSGKGKAGTTVDIEVYAKKDGKFTNRTQKKSIEIGQIGLFVSEVKLLDKKGTERGENKIVFNFGKESESKIVKYINMDDTKKEDVKKQMEEDLKDAGIKDIVNNIISTIK